MKNMNHPRSTQMCIRDRGVKGICLILGALGIASMWTAIFADVGVMIIAVLNATRALYIKDLAKKNEA